MRLALLLLSAVLCLGNTAASMDDNSSGGQSVETRYKESSQLERELEGSGDGISFDDDFWAYDADQSIDVAWTDYSLKPVKCMIL